MISTKNYFKSFLYINSLSSLKDLGEHRGKLNKFFIVKELVTGRVEFGAQASKSRLLQTTPHNLHLGSFSVFESASKASVFYQ